jgi:hypothetical protein
LTGADKAISYGFGSAVFVASVTAIFALLAIYFHKPIFGIDGRALLDASLFAVIAFGIHKKSRVAAVGGLILYLVERVSTLAHGTATGTTGVMAVIFTLYFVHGVRGTFAHRKLASQQTAAPITAGE